MKKKKLNFELFLPFFCDRFLGLFFFGEIEWLKGEKISIVS
jgi:hypothetical protein